MFLSAAMGKGSGKGGSWTRADWDQFNARKYGTKIKQEEDSEQPDDYDAADASQLPEPRYQKRRKGNDFSQYKRQIQHEHGKVLQKQFDMEKQNMDLQFKLNEQDLVSQISIMENERDKFQRVAQSLEQQAATFKESAEKLAAAESAVKLLQGSEEERKDRCEDYRTMAGSKPEHIQVLQGSPAASSAGQRHSNCQDKVLGSRAQFKERGVEQPAGQLQCQEPRVRR